MHIHAFSVILALLLIFAGGGGVALADSLVANQQPITITGTVVDENGEAILGVGVVVKGTGTYQITGANGSFSIAVPNETAVLQFSFTGFEPQELSVGTRRNLSVVMVQDSSLLEEVVVVGYGTQKKATLTGSVAAIGGEDLNLTKNANTQNMLTGKLPGLRVVQKTSEPGTFENQFDIRGMGSPLFVVDGVPRGDFPRMDGNDIESISILKDASAAIYGVRAGNGVVLVTTKTGARQKAKIEYSGYYGIQTPADLMKPIGAWDRALLYNEVTMRNPTAPVKTYNDAYFEELAKGERPDTDWYGEVMRKTAPQSQHNVSIRGGSETADYYVNLGYNNQGSFWRTNSTSYDRYNIRTNLNFTLIENLKASVRLNYITDAKQQQYFSSTDIFAAMWRSIPTDPVYANDNPDYFYDVTSGDIRNVVPMIMPEMSGFRTRSRDILQSSMSLNYKFPVEGLTTNFMFSYDKTVDDNTDYMKKYNEYTYNTSTKTYNPYTQNGPKTQLTRTYGKSASRLWNWSLNYDRTFADKHHVTAMALYEESYGHNYNFNARREFSIDIPYLFAGDTANQMGNGSGLGENANRALVGRVNYEFAGKYLFETAFRYDGSSKFPKGRQWGFFPSVSLGWRLSEEAFVKDNLPVVDNLKLRGSWGKVGDDGAANFQFVEGYDYPVGGETVNARRGRGYVFGSTFVNGLGFRNAPNPDITWYTSVMMNVGLDVDLWNGKLGFSFDMFRRDRSGLLDTPAVVVPGTFGTGISQANLNSDRTKGFEVEVRHFNRLNNDFNYTVTGFVSMTRSMRTKILQPSRSNSYDYWRNNQEDRYNDIWFGKEGEGVYQTWDDIIYSYNSNNGTLPGDPIYTDWDGNGVIDDNDNHPIATTINSGESFQDQRNYPLMNMGLTLQAQYKWLDITLHFQGSAMAYVSYGEQLLNPLSWDGNALGMLLDRWRPSDPDINPYDPSVQWISGRYPMGKTRAEQNSTFNIQNGSYLRLKNLELGFTVPKNAFFNRMKISNLRVFFNTYNLFTITKVIGVDPERPTEGYGYMYPMNRTFNFGGTITF